MTDEEIIERGFVPWKGGDEAPADWDGGEVLRRDGVSECARSLLGSQWRDDNEPIDIIGYRRKQSYPANLTPELAERVVESAKNVLRHFTADGLHKTDPKRLQEADVASLRAIIAKLEPEPDPLTEAVRETWPEATRPSSDEYAAVLSANLAKRNLKIVESTHD